MGSTKGPLTVAGIDLKDPTSAKDFLSKLLSGRPFRDVNTTIRAIYWYGIALAITMASLYNLYVKVLTWSRLRTVKLNEQNIGKPASIVARIQASIKTWIREISYLQFIHSRFSFIAPPALGTSILCLLYLGWVLGLQYYRVEYPEAQHYTSLGMRAAWIAILQMPLLILLAGKENWAGYLTGVSYERLNVLHRWVARVIWLTATLHWAYLQYGWSQFYGLNQLETSTDRAFLLGVVAWALLSWINLSSFSILRNLHYEFFVCQHLISWIGFIVVLAIHIPYAQARIYIYTAIGIYVFERVFRSLHFIRRNFPLGRATIMALPGNVSRITVQSSGLRSWRTGQHVLLSIPRFGWCQSHPATILSTPQSHHGNLVFILKAHRGFTARCLASTYSSMPSIPIAKSASTSRKQIESPSALDIGEKAIPPKQEYIALLGGPYGGSHTDFASFSSVFLIAGSTGVTYTLPILLDLGERAQLGALPVRQILFLWMVKSTSWITWVQEELRCAVDRLNFVGIRCEVQIFVTGNTHITESYLPNTISMFSNPAEYSLDHSDHGSWCTVHSDEIACNCRRNNAIATSSIAAKEAKARAETGSSPTPAISISYLKTSIVPVPDPSKEMHLAQFTTTEIEHSSVSSLPPSSVCASGVQISTTVRLGRPVIETAIRDEVAKAEGEIGVGVCGPTSLSVACRQAIAKISREQRTGKCVVGAACLYLHVEGFGL